MTTADDLRRAVDAAGLAWRGSFGVTPADALPALPGGQPARTLVMLGFTGAVYWQRFEASEEARDGAADPLDRWSQRVIDGLAVRFGGLGLYPSDGPPWLPFQQWARRAESVHPSPLGILIHPRWGLWHAYRGALALGNGYAAAHDRSAASPCDACAGRPCLSACPVAAISPGRYDVATCRAHVRSPQGADCLELGCRARRTCPVGAEHQYQPAEAAFHMRAFVG
jgi:hypothetical protein